MEVHTCIFAISMHVLSYVHVCIIYPHTESISLFQIMHFYSITQSHFYLRCEFHVLAIAVLIEAVNPHFYNFIGFTKCIVICTIGCS